MYDATTLAVLAHQELGFGVADIVVDSAAGLVYVSGWSARRIYVYRADDLELVDEIGDASFSGPAGLAVDAPTQRIFVARTNRSFEPHVEALSVIQRHATGAHTIDRTIPMGTTVQPWDVAVDSIAGFVYVLGLGGGGVPPQLIVLDRLTLTELGRVNTTHFPQAVTAVPGSGVAYVSVFAGVKVIDARRLQVVATIPATVPQSAAVTPSGHVLAGARDGQLLRAAAPAALTIAEWR
jgi:DNA-binding beta-propeller fold protein YncE